MIKIRTLNTLEFAPGTPVFFRVDYNVPLDGGKISDATRIEATLPTLRQLLGRGAAVIIAAHLGRPKGKRTEKDSLAPVRTKLVELLGAEVEGVSENRGNSACKSIH